MNIVDIGSKRHGKSVRELAGEIGVSPEALLGLLSAVGVKKSGLSSVVSESEKELVLKHLVDGAGSPVSSGNSRVYVRKDLTKKVEVRVYKKPKTKELERTEEKKQRQELIKYFKEYAVDGCKPDNQTFEEVVGGVSPYRIIEALNGAPEIAQAYSDGKDWNAGALRYAFVMLGHNIGFKPQAGYGFVYNGPSNKQKITSVDAAFVALAKSAQVKIDELVDNYPEYTEQLIRLLLKSKSRARDA